MRNTGSLIILLAALMLSACGTGDPVEPTLDINFIHTAAAETVIAEFTQTAIAAPPTDMPTIEATSTTPSVSTEPTATATVSAAIPFESSPTAITCDDAAFISDVTVPDGTQKTPGEDFVKTWRVKNTGTCVWGAGYSVIHGYDITMDGIAEPLAGTVAPGEEVEVSVRFKAPAQTGEYRSYWRMANAGGVPFGEFFYVNIVVR